jgi:hypothetical protein
VSTQRDIWFLQGLFGRTFSVLHFASSDGVFIQGADGVRWALGFPLFIAPRHPAGFASCKTGDGGLWVLILGIWENEKGKRK